MTDYHVITPAESQLVMQTEHGRVAAVLPAPMSSLPRDARAGAVGVDRFVVPQTLTIEISS